MFSQQDSSEDEDIIEEISYHKNKIRDCDITCEEYVKDSTNEENFDCDPTLDNSFSANDVPSFSDKFWEYWCIPDTPDSPSSIGYKCDDGANTPDCPSSIGSDSEYGSGSECDDWAGPMIKSITMYLIIIYTEFFCLEKCKVWVIQISSKLSCRIAEM